MAQTSETEQAGQLMSSTSDDSQPALEQGARSAAHPPALHRIEPMMNVGKQCAFYLAIVAALAGGVAFIGPLDQAPAVAQEQTIMPLEGEFDMLAPLDAQDDSSPKSVAVFYVTGMPAQKMWDAFPMQPVKDECVGRLSKFNNGIVCYGSNADGTVPEHPYECTIGIDMKNQSLTLPQDC
jgi:hypothetical protein